LAKWIPRITIALKQATEPELACELLMVCMSDEAPEPEAVALPKVSDYKSCLECKTFAKLIQAELRNEGRERGIDDWVVNNVCQRAPNDQVKRVCIGYVEKYGEKIIELMADKYFDPTTLCVDELKMCKPRVQHEVEDDVTTIDNSLSPMNPNIEIELLQPTKAEMCDTCLQVVKTLDQLLSMGPVEQELSHLATKVCNHIDAKKRAQCVTLIEIYGPYFLQMIGRLGNPRQVCKSIDICLIAGETHLLGGHKCTFGPTYWCHTSAHADACKASDYCKRKVWAAIE